MHSSISFCKAGFCILLSVALLFSCKTDKNKFSDTPFLELKGAYVFNNGADKDSFVLLEMHYQDGDGDIGFNDADTMSPFGFNDPWFNDLFIWIYVKKNGAWIKPVNPLSPTLDTMNFHERLQKLTPTGRNKWIEGDLAVRIPAEPYSLKPDTVRFEIQLVDRSLKKSALIQTQEILLKH